MFEKQFINKIKFYFDINVKVRFMMDDLVSNASILSEKFYLCNSGESLVLATLVMPW